jgi:hypothetical protein
MSATSRAASWVAVVAVIGVAVGVTALYLDERDVPLPSPSPAPVGIEAHAKDIRTVPDVGRNTRRRTAAEIASTIEDVYSRAFTRPIDPPEVSPSPGPARRVKDLFTPRAVAALKAKPDVFDIGGLVVTSGSIDFSGIVTFADDEPHDALVEVDFVGRATPAESAQPVVRVHQTGTLGLRRTDDRWLVRSFDLRMATRPEPTSMPSPRL